MKIHIVQLGDTLWKLAEKYNASFEELKKVNSHLADPEKLMPGMKIKIPGSKKTVQKSESKKEQMTPITKEKKTTKKEQKTPVSKEETKTPKKEEKQTVQKEEQKKEEHPFKQKTPTPIAVLQEDDQKEKKKEQFEAVMPKMPQAPAMPVLEKEMKTEKMPPKKMSKPPKPKEHKQEKPKPIEKQQPASMEEPQTQPAEQKQPAFDFETYQPPAAMPCEPMPFFPQMIPIFYMPCPPMHPPVHHPHPIHPGMQQEFPMMPPMGDCGCGSQYQFAPMQGNFNPVPAGFGGFSEEQFGATDQQFQGMMPSQQQPSIHQTNQQTTEAEPYSSQNDALTSNHNTNNNGPLSPYKPNQLPTSASFMNEPRQSQRFAENRNYFQVDQMSLSNSQGNTFYPKPPFFPEHPNDKNGSNS
ncbi:SafA/ExsA family spore coat assembly protein [Oceanobacillus jeddahense]|uniref:SafA/ExsA family spore coat assembly protein n=1 Tax=Oceanobacillus jeddahense TaxID=1462527 RepID=A0ABY5JYF1_9BACI|nr:SafA/ExsA family spore coat assembly protein [Oceanobacillus jeddahense]UUI05346.1 SafA/ExsA family spore coat assembly protein [Oceanobacillus jeddahense]